MFIFITQQTLFLTTPFLTSLPKGGNCFTKQLTDSCYKGVLTKFPELLCWTSVVIVKWIEIKLSGCFSLILDTMLCC